ncbi:hypothetical protein GGP41_007809 [Bipolaris sorokiniana]|uniref:Secreted protein n=1 Tax=Cochliobolus sativus TaxID=45130 RepID=A0A8H5ZNZ9_COCSA|nr:hypothetical protein GGP41_007809 [Bipolaris sorokiniana]
MTLSVALCACWRRALASLTRLALASLYDYSFCLYTERFSRASVSRRLLGSLAAAVVALRDSVAAAEPLLLYIVSLSALLSALQYCYL